MGSGPWSPGAGMLAASSIGAEDLARERAVIVTVGPIEWRADDEVWVTVTYFRTRTQSAVRRYPVVREESGWLSLGPIVLDGPP